MTHETLISGIALDLESMGTSPNSIILSVGMCRFDVQRKTIWDDFQVNIDAKDSARYGMTVSQETIDWWASQPKEVYKRAVSNPVSLDTGLAMIRGYIEKTKSPNMWSYGAIFDFPMLEWSFRAAGHKTVPWKFRRVHCGRTIANIFGPFADTGGLKHAALDDAKWLANSLIKFNEYVTDAPDDDIPF